MRLLIVEDEVPLAATLRRGLAAEGFDSDVVHDGGEGLWLAQSTPYAAIVLDLLLPTLNGFQVSRQLRAADNWTPILILTAKDGDYDLAEALDCGADDFLTKPFSFVVLTARLRALIRRGRVARPAVLENGSLSFDPFTRTCRVGVREVALTGREAAVLAVLMRRHPDVVAKDELLAEVWGPGFDGSDNVVDVYIGHLRRKLAGADSTTRIVNLRGIGFRTEVEQRAGGPR